MTAPLDGTILPGVTRDSILALARNWKEFEVSEVQLFIKTLTMTLICVCQYWMVTNFAFCQTCCVMFVIALSACVHHSRGD